MDLKNLKIGIAQLIVLGGILATALGSYYSLDSRVESVATAMEDKVDARDIAALQEATMTLKSATGDLARVVASLAVSNASQAAEISGVRSELTRIRDQLDRLLENPPIRSSLKN